MEREGAGSEGPGCPGRRRYLAVRPVASPPVPRTPPLCQEAEPPSRRHGSAPTDLLSCLVLQSCRGQPGFLQNRLCLGSSPPRGAVLAPSGGRLVIGLRARRCLGCQPPCGAPSRLVRHIISAGSCKPAHGTFGRSGPPPREGTSSSSRRTAPPDQQGAQRSTT